MTQRVSLVQIYVCLAFIAVIVAADGDEECNRSKCPGPLAFYKIERCIPVYENEGDCCAKKYNCDHPAIRSRSQDKCYVKDNVYEIGDHLKPEDLEPCDVTCTCRRGLEDIAIVLCTTLNCPFVPTKPDCYLRNSVTECCEIEEVCPEKPEDRATCIVDGETYVDGEYFSIREQPELSCICLPGYEGKNVEPFCVASRRNICQTEFYDARTLPNNCAPIYFSNQLPQVDCPYSSLCQNDNDTVIHKHDDLDAGHTVDEENVCLFGNLTMHLGDELIQYADLFSFGVKCVCEVPPVPTCQQQEEQDTAS
ncbi:hypothetical protein HN011_011268 [Eciton burchellii]|nr:hypothetical protein HN011_011268 [Eciton burchellii]